MNIQFVENHVRIVSLNHMYVLLSCSSVVLCMVICMLYNSHTIGKGVTALLSLSKTHLS